MATSPLQSFAASSLSDQRWRSLPRSQAVMSLKHSSTRSYHASCCTKEWQNVAGRRDMLIGLVGVSVIPQLFEAKEALAAKAPKGFQVVFDKFDGYQFLYPFGWQEVSIKGQDATYKDVIEPLESVGISIVETDKADVHELGSAEEVAKALVEKVLAPTAQKSEVLNVKERVANGKTYYDFEFVAKARNYTRHALGSVGIANGKFYTLTTGANERRWGKMEDRLKTVLDSFTLSDVLS